MAVGDLDEFTTNITGASIPAVIRSVRQSLQALKERFKAAPYVAKSLFDANTILKADTDDTPVALTVAEQTVVGRVTSGSIDALTDDEVHGIIFGTTNYIEQDIALNSTQKVIFRDADIYISSKDDGRLDVDADTSIDLNAAVAISGNLTFDSQTMTDIVTTIGTTGSDAKFVTEQAVREALSSAGAGSAFRGYGKLEAFFMKGAA